MELEIKKKIKNEDGTVNKYKKVYNSKNGIKETFIILGYLFVRLLPMFLFLWFMFDYLIEFNQAKDSLDKILVVSKLIGFASLIYIYKWFRSW